MKSPPTPNAIKKSLNDSIQSVVNGKGSYVLHPGHDMIRSGKLPFSTCLSRFLDLKKYIRLVRFQVQKADPRKSQEALYHCVITTLSKEEFP